MYAAASVIDISFKPRAYNSRKCCPTKLYVIVLSLYFSGAAVNFECIQFIEKEEGKEATEDCVIMIRRNKNRNKYIWL